ncbi:hypothetical protein BO83DRAFT_20641 [Aspergillus eucalypticola CBS 122712]|uniref:Uncharacterized protein n=1 Tax=Aspergillus eucalypticola (strain CBS 122712 / IBT 29274) TaxID=1448314 RepID=A0A317VJ21_ASPEC|nr:uncharacterized protein BO83DRAFT_20641 [Aspergillus eucalypticola CBS 122712]PWY73925.1 hypothetical protein BO83DRAFT_20641 [Aspergillus eucalypticola CBS 122712]
MIHRARATSNIRSKGKGTQVLGPVRNPLVLRGVSLWNTALGCFLFLSFYYLAHILLSREEHIIQNLPARADLPASAFVSLFCTCPSLLSSVH